MTPAERAKIEAADAKWVRPPQSFIDRWNTVWTVRCKVSHFAPLKDEILGKYDPENAPDPLHTFRAYDDIWLTYEEAMRVLEECQWAPGQTNLSGCLQTAHSRVAVPFTFGAHSQNVNLASIAVYNDDIEELFFGFGGDYAYGFTISNLNTAFHATSSKLRKIHGILPVSNNCTFNSWASMATNLESFRLYGLATSIDVHWCSKLDFASIEYMVDNARNTTAITITLHPEAYARLTDELIATAAEKQITFATA